MGHENIEEKKRHVDLLKAVALSAKTFIEKEAPYHERANLPWMSNDAQDTEVYFKYLLSQPQHTAFFPSLLLLH